MTLSEHFFTYWYFSFPQLILAALAYTLVARYILSYFFAEDSDLVIWRVFKNITDPLIRFFRAISPRIVSDGLIGLIGVVWLISARLTLYVVARAAGMPLLEGGPGVVQ